MSRFTEVLIQLRDFKKLADQLLVGLSNVEGQFSSRESELTTLQNQIAVTKVQKDSLEKEAAGIIAKAKDDAERIMQDAQRATETARAVSIQAAKDREESQAVIDAAKAIKASLDNQRAILDEEQRKHDLQVKKLQEAIR